MPTGLKAHAVSWWSTERKLVSKQIQCTRPEPSSTSGGRVGPGTGRRGPPLPFPSPGREVAGTPGSRRRGTCPWTKPTGYDRGMPPIRGSQPPPTERRNFSSSWLSLPISLWVEARRQLRFHSHQGAECLPEGTGDITLRSNPWSWNMCWMRAWTVSLVEGNLGSRIKCAALEKRSTTINMTTWPWDPGRPVTKFSTMCNQGQLGTDNNCRSPWGLWELGQAASPPCCGEQMATRTADPGELACDKLWGDRPGRTSGPTSETLDKLHPAHTAGSQESEQEWPYPPGPSPPGPRAPDRWQRPTCLMVGWCPGSPEPAVGSWGVTGHLA